MASLLIRLCALMVAAFGSRPCGVSAVERTPAPWIIGLQARDRVVAYATAREPAAPSIGLLVRAPSVPRAPTGSSCSAGSAAAETVDRASTAPSASRIQAPRIARRTPCAACGDGSPYDATAPPHRDVTARA